MDRVTALVAIAHLRLRLEWIERNPQLLEDAMLKIKKPIELIGLKTQIIRAEGQEKQIAGLGVRYNKVQGDIDELIGAHTEHVGDLEHAAVDLRRKIEGMVGSNGDPNDGQTGQESDGRGQTISSETGK